MKKYKNYLLIVICAVCLMGCGKSSTTNKSEDTKQADKNAEIQETKYGKAQETKNKEIQEETTGSAELKVPDVTGKSIKVAETQLNDMGFDVVIKEEFSDEFEENFVISQSPEAENDLKLSKGDKVTLTVSKGKEKSEAKYLDTIVYQDFSTECKETKMSAYSGEDFKGELCERAIRFACSGRKEYYENPDETHYVKVMYALDDVQKFSTILTHGEFDNSCEYIHVNLYKDDELLFSMDINKDSNPMELEYDLSDAGVFIIELSHESLDDWAIDYHDSYSYLIFSDAKFE